MSTLSPKDRVSLCMFSFADGRRCRTPRLRNHPHFCYDHAEKEARARAKQSLGTDLARYFSGQYLSACDLSTALGCLIPAVVRGDVKPKVARTVAYMAQTLLQSIHISQHEYCKAFGTDAWRTAIANSVHGNHIYRFPPHRTGGRNSSRSEIPTPSGPGREAVVAPQPQQPSNAQSQPQPAAPTSPACHPERSEGSQLMPSAQHSPVAQAACPEGTRRVRGETSRSSAAAQTQSPQQLASPPTQTPVNCHSARPDLVGERSDERPARCASPESYREESAFSASSSPAPAPEPAPPPHNPLPSTAAEFAQQVLARRNSSRPDRAHPVRPGSTGETAGEQTTRHVTSIPKPTPPTQAPPTSTTSVAPPADNTPHVPTTQSVPSAAPAPQPEKPPRPTPQPTYNWQTGELHFDHTCRLRIDGKLV
jgi:hypothetical protein